MIPDLNYWLKESGTYLNGNLDGTLVYFDAPTRPTFRLMTQEENKYGCGSERIATVAKNLLALYQERKSMKPRESPPPTLQQRKAMNRNVYDMKDDREVLSRTLEAPDLPVAVACMDQLDIMFNKSGYDDATWHAYYSKLAALYYKYQQVCRSQRTPYTNPVSCQAADAIHGLEIKYGVFQSNKDNYPKQ